MNQRRKRDWSIGGWIKQHLHEPGNDLLEPLIQRALRDYLRKRAEPDGSLIVDRDDPFGCLIRMLGAHEPELDLARQALAALADEGILETDGRSIWMPERVESQLRTPAAGSAESAEPVPPDEPLKPRPTSTNRVRAHRERKRNERDAQSAVSPPVRGTLGPVSSLATGAVSAGVPASRGYREQDPAHSLGDQKDQKDQIDHPHHPEDARASGAVSSGEATAVASETDGEDEDDDEDETLNEVGSGDGQGSGAQDEPTAHAPRTLAEALLIPVAVRAALVVDKAELAEPLRPDQWPEVKALAEAFAAARGCPSQLLGRYALDNTVRLAVALYGAGYSQTELVHVVRVVAKQEWARGKGLGSLLTFKVVDANRPKFLVKTKTEADLSPRVAAALARARESLRHREAG